MLNVVLASDENFVPLLSVAIISLLENNSDFDEITIYVIDDNIFEESKNKLHKQIEKYNNSKLIFIENSIVNTFLKGQTLESHLPLSTYSRLFLTELIPKDVEKIIYLDCDILITSSLKSLYDINLEENMIAGVLEPVPSLLKNYIGLSNEDNYINAGILLINLKKWREENIIIDFINFLNNIEFPVDADQGVLNSVLNDKTLIINPCYNLTPYYHYKNFEGVNKMLGDENKHFYDEKTIKNSQNNPVIIHFLSKKSFRPWFNPNQPYRKIYEDYANLSLFNNEIFKEDNASISIVEKLYVFIEIKNPKYFSKLIISSLWNRRLNNVIKNRIESSENKVVFEK